MDFVIFVSTDASFRALRGTPVSVLWVVRTELNARTALVISSSFLAWLLVNLADMLIEEGQRLLCWYRRLLVVS